MTIKTDIQQLGTEVSGSPGDEVGSSPWEGLSLDWALPVDTVCEPSLPEPILLASLRDGRLRVVAPLRVQFVREEGKVVAQATDVDEFGFGSNPSEALIDLQRALAELYFGLDREKHRLGPDLERIWRFLNSAIKKSRA